MRKTYFIFSVLILSGFLFMSLNTPSGAVKGNFATVLKMADVITWKMLGEIKYEKKTSKDYPEGVMFPIINPTLKAKKDKKITITGFIIPVDNKTYALSKNVFASCFFCGQAGPETIMGIQFKNPGIKLKPHKFVPLEAKFWYNYSDVNDWIYHIDDAVITKGQ